MTLKQKTYENLRHRIITNDLPAGQQLYEKELMKAYGIGRTPLREIFHDLQRDGLIEILPKLGTKVVVMDLKILRETVQLRRELEGLAAELATRNIKANQLEQFRQYLDEAARIDGDDPEALVKMSAIDMKIHELVHETAGNDQLVQILRVLLDKMTMYWFQVGFSAGEFQDQIAELDVLYQSMLKREAIESKRIMKRHIDHFAELIKNQIF